MILFWKEHDQYNVLILVGAAILVAIGAIILIRQFQLWRKRKTSK